MKTFNSVILTILLINTAFAQIPDGVYFIHLSNGLVMEAEANNVNSNGCKIQNGDNYDLLNQRWQVMRTASGSYRIKNLASNKMLDADAGSVNRNGCKVQLWDEVPSNRNQEWTLTPVGGGRYAVRCAASASNKVLDLTGYAIDTRGTPIQLWDYSSSNTSNQIWTFLPTNTPLNRTLTYNTWRNLTQSLIVKTSYFKINNYTPTAFQYDGNNTFKFRKPNDVKFRIGGVSSQEQIYDLYPFRINPFTVYIKNLNGKIESITADGGRLKISLIFESDDTEIACNCIDNLGCGATGDPNFHLNNLRCEAWVEPYAEGGQIKVRNIKTRLTGNIQHEGFNFTIAHAQPLLPFFNSPIFEALSSKFTERLNEPQTIEGFNRSLNTGLASTGFFGTAPHIYSIKIDNRGNLIYIYR